MQKQEKRRDLRLKRFWRSPKTTSSEDSTGYESPTRHAKPSSDAQRFNHLHYTSLAQSASAAIDQPSMSQKPACSLPLLQVWPSQDSPRGEADGQSFVFPIIAETSTSSGRGSGSGGRGSTSTGGSTGAGSTGDSGGAGSSSSGACSTTTSTTTTTTSTPGSSNNLNAATREGDCSITLDEGHGEHLTLLPVDSAATTTPGQRRRSSLFCDTLHAGDSGIDSVQASPSPQAIPPPPGSTLIALSVIGTHDSGRLKGGSCHVSPATTPTQGSPNLSLGASTSGAHGHKTGGRMASRASISVPPSQNYRRKSSALLHPDHARLFALRMKHAAALERAQTSPDQTSIEDCSEFGGGNGGGASANLRLCSASSSTTSSLTSVAAVSLGGMMGAAAAVTSGAAASSSLAAVASGSAASAALAAASGSQQRVSDPWLQPQSDRERESRYERRRSSTMTARYSLFDALDLEYALLRAAARGSVGPYSLSESIHKLTFTQSLAFPALARGLATKRRRSATRTSSRPLNPNESGVNTCAKVVTAVILVGISFMVFLIVYKFVRT